MDALQVEHPGDFKFEEFVILGCEMKLNPKLWNVNEIEQTSLGDVFSMMTIVQGKVTLKGKYQQSSFATENKKKTSLDTTSPNC